MIYADAFCENLGKWIEGKTCVYLGVGCKCGDRVQFLEEFYSKKETDDKRKIFNNSWDSTNCTVI